MRNGAPIRPVAVSCRTHAITKRPAFEDRGYLRTTYKDTEDYAFLHVIFEDGMIADVMTSELVLGGVYDFIEVYANNHRTRCHMQPIERPQECRQRLAGARRSQDQRMAALGDGRPTLGLGTGGGIEGALKPGPRNCRKWSKGDGCKGHVTYKLRSPSDNGVRQSRE